MVRESFLNEITNVISQSNFFDVTDFDLTTKAENTSYTLEIQYKYDPRFWYVAQIPRAGLNSSEKITVSVAPGEINQREHGSVSNRHYLSKSIAEWLMRVKEELLAIPVYRQLDEQKKHLEDMFSRLQNVEDVAFTRDEAKELKAELDNLREQMIEHIKANAANQTEQKAKIQSITNDIDTLKASVEVLSKPNWARAAISRFYKWTKDPDNRGMIKDGVEVATKLLSGKVDDH